MNKPILRQQMRQRRVALSPDERTTASVQVEKQLQGLCRQQKWPAVTVYLATNEEVNLDGFIEWLLKRGLSVYAPRAQGFAPLGNLEDVTMGNFGVREPRSAVTSLCQETVFLVPGLAFDKRGGRLGFGGGWFDRALTGFPHSLKIGIAFDCQIVDEVPREAHDIRMDVVLTPSGELRMENGKWRK